MRSSTTKNKVIKIIFSSSAILFVLFTWTIIAIVYENDLLFPNILEIIKRFFLLFTNKSSLINVLSTCLRVVICVTLCLLIGIVITMLYIAWPNTIYFFRPLIRIMRSMPLAIISIFIFIILGSKIGPYSITILMTLPVVFEGLITGIDQISKDITDDLSLLTGETKIKINQVYLPIIKPYITMSIIQALGMSFKVLIMGEYICQTNKSIGKELYNIKTTLEMADLLAYGILIILIVTILELFLARIKTNKY